MDANVILAAIPSTEPATFGEFLNALGDEGPSGGVKGEWADFFNELRALEKMNMISIDWNGRNIESLMLTDIGAERVREARNHR